jgi:hypothetical protein
MTAEKLEKLDRRVERIENQIEVHSKSGPTRRAAIAGLTGLSIAGIAADSATAQQSPWDDTDGDSLLELPNYKGIDVTETRTNFASISDSIHVPPDYGGATGIGEAFNNARADFGVNTLYNVSPGDYVQDSETFDLTGVRSGNIALNLKGVRIEQRLPVSIDCTGSHSSLTISGGNIRGDTQSDIDCGLLLARDSTNNAAGKHNITGLRISGRYDTAALYNVTSETNQYFGCEFEAKIGGNFGADGTAGVHISGENNGRVTSPHSTIVSDTDSTATTGGNQFYSGSIRGHTGIRLEVGNQNPIKHTAFYSVYGGGVDEWVFLDLQEEKEMMDIAFENCWVADDLPQYIFRASSQSNTTLIHQFAIRGGRYHCTGGSGANCIEFSNRNVELRNPDIEPSTSWNQESGMNIGDVTFGRVSYDDSTLSVESADRCTLMATNPQSISISGTVNNVLKKGTRSPEIIQADTSKQTRMSLSGFGTDLTGDLSKITPDYDGQVRRDDGTNFTTGEYAFADLSTGVWRAFNDPGADTVQY